MSTRGQWATLGLAFATACSFSPATPFDSTFTDDAGHPMTMREDGGFRDGGVRNPDDGGETDAGDPRDGGVTDLGVDRDGGFRDGGFRDGGERDSGPRDGGPIDSGVRDGGPAPLPRLSNIASPPPAPMGRFDLAMGATCTVDTGTPALGSGCPAMALSVEPVAGWSAAVISVVGGTIAGTVTVTGTRPLIIVSDSDFRIRDTATIDLSATGMTSGPGAGRDCNATHGPDGLSTGCGGGGGGHGTVGGEGGASTPAPNDETPGGATLGPSTSSRLQGGCRGGDGNPSGVGGGGGGALQISARGTLLVEGNIGVAGGGGAGGVFATVPAGGAGGGAGGTVVFEADVVQVTMDATINAQGGGGGQGATPPSAAGNGEAGQDGRDFLDTAPPGGLVVTGGAPGGNGGRQPIVSPPTDGDDAFSGGEAGGGGGGAYGRFDAYGETRCAISVTRVLANRSVSGGVGCL